MIDLFIAYVLGLFIVPNLPPGLVRRVLGFPYRPLVALGLWHRWSMYSPDVPPETRITVFGVVLDDGTFEPIPMPGFDDENGFGRALGLRFIAFQFALAFPPTDYLKPDLCRLALRRWSDAQTASPSAHPVAVEVRVLSYPTPPPGESAEDPGARSGAPHVDVQTVWSEPVRDEGPRS